MSQATAQAVMKRTTTPDQVTSLVRRFCNRVVPGGKPVYLEETPQPGARPQQCFKNVEAKISGDGGSVQHGWTIWFWASVLMEAEFHGVWKSPSGELVDVTPRLADVKRVLFLPDAKRQYEGRQIDNIRHALSKDELVTDFIALAETAFWVMNRGSRADRDEVPVRELNDIEKAVLIVTERASMELSQGRKANDPCLCDSGQKYRSCCSSDVKLLLKDVRRPASR